MLGGSVPWLLWLLTVASTLGAGVLRADTLRVPSEFPTIQGAIQAAAPEDTILVGPGFYDENLDTLGKRLVLIGEAGAQQTVVDGGRRARVLTMRPGGVVEGFTLQRGRASSPGGGGAGGGILIEWIEGGPLPSALVRNNIIRDNIAGVPDNGLGGGVFIGAPYSGAIIESNEIRNNYAGDRGGGIADNGYDSVVRNNVISGNGTHLCGGGASLYGSTFVGNLVKDNWSDHFGGGVCGGGIEIRNNTVVGNIVSNPLGAAGIDIRGGGIDIRGGGPIVANNIVALNRGIGITGVRCDRLECNDSWGNDRGDYTCDTTGTSNFSADPLFCGEYPEDYQISEQSPCAPAGNPGCGLVGAFPVGCSTTPVQPTTWGRIKKSYRY